MNYKKRIVDDILNLKLEAKGGVVIEGPKWCGKTTTAMQQAKSVLKMDDPRNLEMNIQLSEIDPVQLLEGNTPRLIDEWQIAPKLWDAARYEIDNRDLEGQFILTGSSVPVNSDKITHTGTGRFTWLNMRTMSLFESEESSGEVSLNSLFDNPDMISGKNPLTFQKLAFVTARGGWPKSINMRRELALLQAYDYCDAVVKSDINRADGVIKRAERVKRLMKSYARNQGTQISLKKLKDDIFLNDSMAIDEDTINSYLNALKMIFVIEDMPAWNPNLRSSTAIRTSDTKYFVDPSIAIASLGLGPDDLVKDLNTFGLMFECLCVRDLRVYADSLNGSVYHYRDKSGLECDAVVHLRNGHYGLIEIKLGGPTAIEEGVKNLKSLSDKIDDTKMYKPDFMMVLIGVGEHAYKRQDGVFIVPIGCLRN